VVSCFLWCFVAASTLPRVGGISHLVTLTSHCNIRALGKGATLVAPPCEMIVWFFLSTFEA
ncbi:hypothetical protein ABTB66_18185, partial [Acinetobacter baumannii]